jgi:hypothetical protein
LRSSRGPAAAVAHRKPRTRSDHAFGHPADATAEEQARQFLGHGNAPFRRWKRETYRGGTSDPFLVHWPAGIQARGQVRDQYAHIIDMVPAVLNALGIEPPATIRAVAQSPLHGVSLAHTFDDASAPTRHRTQYFEMFGHRAIDHDGWRAVCPWPGPSFAEAGQPFGAAITADTLTELDANGWELYRVASDPAENHNVASEHRDKLIELIALWYIEAGKNNVFPLDGTAAPRLITERPQVAEPRAHYVYRPGTQTLPFWVGRRVLNRPHSITADVDIPASGAEGVLLCQGSNAGGWSFYVQDGRLHYAHNYVGRAAYQVATPGRCPPASTSCGSSSSQPGSPTWPTARARPAAPSYTSTGSSPARPTSRSPRR